MNPVRNYIRKFIYITTAVIAGIFLLVLQLSSDMNSNLLKPEFHRQMFVKHDIYSPAYRIINSSMKDFISNLESSSPGSFKMNGQVLENLEKSITPDMVKANIDSIREGVFQYFRGERVFLPDIYLDLAMEDSRDQETTLSGNLADPSSQALSHIKKVNLNAILLYIGRNDITDNLHAMKLLYFISARLPWFSILAILLLLLGRFVSSRSFLDLSKWTAISCAVYGALGIMSGIGLTLFTNLVMPEHIYPIAMSVPLDNVTIIAYISDCIMHTAVFLSITGGFFLAFSVGLFYLPLLFPSLFNMKHSHTNVTAGKTYKIVKYAVYSLLFMLIISSIGYKFMFFMKDFDSNNFSKVVSRLMSRNTVTQVIAASDDAIYSLHVNLVDKKENKPLPGIRLNIDGNSGVQKNSFNKDAVTDEDGSIKLKLNKGEFRLDFPLENFPVDYMLPSPVYFDLNTPGTTIITVSLDAIEKKEAEPGVVEVEVLDDENKPIPDLELYIEDVVNAPGHPDSIFSYTNAEGIAVFKVNEGICRINFTESGFPKQYLLPNPIEASPASGKVTRHSIQLVKVKSK